MKNVRFHFALALFAILLLPGAARAEHDLASRLAGRVVLEVERHGEAWYVSPADGRRYFLGSPDDAWHALSAHGLGISDADLAKVPLPGEKGDANLAKRLAGRILLQVESRGEAWYVDPIGHERHRLATPAETFNVLRDHGLGISDADISMIPRKDETPDSVHHSVPFVAQAPFAEWSDNRQHEACEEATVYMALKWAMNDDADPTEARDLFLQMSEWQRSTFGYYQDTSARDTLDRLIKGYSGFENAELRTDISDTDIKSALRDGKLVIAPVNGRTIGNPYFAPPGPLRHMVVITGYDAGSDTFIVHDPGTRKGKDMHYPSGSFMNALGDYTSGAYAPLPTRRAKTMIVISR